MRKLQGDDDDCCAYREKRRANRVSRNAKKNVTSSQCPGDEKRDVGCAFDRASPSKSSACSRVENKSRKIKKPETTSLDQVLTRIKPSFDERTKYVNVKHILCILDADKAVRLKKVQELRKAMDKNENCDETDVASEDVGRKKGATENSKADKEGGGFNSENVKGKGTQGKSEDTVGGKKSKQVLRDGNRDGKTHKKTKIVKDEFANAEGAERKCNSICSIDSEVDVGEFALTKEEISSIEKDRKQPDA